MNIELPLVRYKRPTIFIFERAMSCFAVDKTKKLKMVKFSLYSNFVVIPAIGFQSMAKIETPSTIF